MFEGRSVYKEECGGGGLTNPLFGALRAKIKPNRECFLIRFS